MAKSKGSGRTRGKLIVIGAGGITFVPGSSVAQTPPPPPPAEEFSKFATASGADAWGNELHGAYLDNLSAAERSAISQYTGSGYGKINSRLRQGTHDPAAHPNSPFTKTVESLDSAINNAPPVNQNVVLRRGISAKRIKSFTEGDEFVDDGFVSTSVKPDWHWGGWGTEIHVPKGSKGLYVRKLSSHSSEYEFMLPRSSVFRVKKLGTSWSEPTILEYLGTQ